jgi:RhtB (resistance to homoserine/threonine) family protein
LHGAQKAAEFTVIQKEVFLMYGIQNFELFCLSAIVLSVTPGPDTFYILGRTISQGTNSGIASVLGISTGVLIHTIAAAVGLSTILATSALVFKIIKLIGAAYLIYLGITLILASKDTHALSKNNLSSSSLWKIYRQGVMTNVLNPKVALFFLSFLPQFIDPNHGNVTSFIFLGFTYVFACTVWYLIVAVFSSAIAGTFQKNTLWIRSINKISGSIFIGLGLNLAFSKTD